MLRKQSQIILMDIRFCSVVMLLEAIGAGFMSPHIIAAVFSELGKCNFSGSRLIHE
jgi:hypothetical protein